MPGYDGSFQGWSGPASLSKNIPLYFQKVLPIDERFMLLIGGSKKPGLFDVVDKSPEFSLYLLAIEKVNKVVIAEKPLRFFAVHSAVALYKKNELFIVGGQFAGQWTKRVYSIIIRDSFGSQDSVRLVADLPAPLFGPSITIPENSPFCMYAIGANLVTRVTELYKLTKRKEDN